MLLLYLNSYPQTQGYIEFSSMFSCKSAIVQHFIFRSMIYFHGFFGVCKVCLQVYFLYGYLFFPSLFIETSVLSPLHCLCTFVKNQLTIFVWVYFWSLVNWTRSPKDYSHLDTSRKCKGSPGQPPCRPIGYCDCQFYMSTWLGNSIQVFTLILIWMLL